jgi:hypothetical protein
VDGWDTHKLKVHSGFLQERYRLDDLQPLPLGLAGEVEVIDGPGARPGLSVSVRVDERMTKKEKMWNNRVRENLVRVLKVLVHSSCF